jgi:membrane protease YdiL (CAAX protease family)
MDQQTKHDVLLVRSGGAAPYGLLGLGVSLVAILVMAAALAAAVAALILAGQVAALGVDETRSFYLSLRFDIRTQAKLSALAVTIVYVALACATLVTARHRQPTAWRDLVALRRVGPGWRRIASVAVMVLVYAALASLALASLRERHIPIDGPTDTLLVALIVLNYVVCAPVAEELLFRGWIYTGLRHRFGFGTTLFATSFLFAAIHWEPRHMVLVLPLAFALGFIREQTGSIKPTVALHASYNSVIVAIALLTQ